MPSVLLELFLAHVGDAFGGAIPNADDVEEWLHESVSAAHAAYPKVRQTPEEFTLRLASAVASLPTPSAFRKLHTTDLDMAGACARHDPHALAAFEERYLPMARRAVERLSVPGFITEEVLSELREKLFIGVAESQPLIGEYGGRGSLAAWVRSVIVHAAMNATRKEVKQQALEEADELIEPGDPELAYLKSMYATEFRIALRETMGTLSDRERNLLRQRFFDGLNIDALGNLYGVHRATAARWVNDACESLLTGVRANLARRLSLSEDELDSLIGTGRSSLDITLSRLLRGEP